MLLNIFRTIFDWSEVWALLIPLASLIIFKPSNKWVRPVKWYLFTALLLNIIIDFIWYVNKIEIHTDFIFSIDKKAQEIIWNNNICYNLNSIARLLFFSWFFATQGKAFRVITKIIPIVFLTGVILFFTFLKSIFFVSSYLLATEAGLLLIYCLWYTNKIMREDKPSATTSYPQYWVAGGLTLYTSVNFFIFLFYDYLNANYDTFLVRTWDVHNFLFIILCICVAIAFYNERSRK
jgi:hypothetical protein